MRVTACSGRRNSDKVGALQANRPLRAGFFTLILNKDMLQAPAPTALQFAHFPTDLGQRWILTSWIGSPLTLLLLACLVPIWRGGQWGLGRRLIASALALTSTLFVFLLAYWNVLGAPTLG